MSAAASDLDKRGGDIESYLENFCRCSTLHNKIGINSVPHQQLKKEIDKNTISDRFRVRFLRVDQKVKHKKGTIFEGGRRRRILATGDEEIWRKR